MTTERFDISVYTLIQRHTGEAFAEYGPFRWFGVDQEIVDWLSGSCKITALWLIDLPEVIEGKSYTVFYRTIVTQEKEVISDTKIADFPNLSYEDMDRFESWALAQLDELRVLFKKKHGQQSAVTRHRSKLKALCRLVFGRKR